MPFADPEAIKRMQSKMANIAQRRKAYERRKSSQGGTQTPPYSPEKKKTMLSASMGGGPGSGPGGRPMGPPDLKPTGPTQPRAENVRQLTRKIRANRPGRPQYEEPGMPPEMPPEMPPMVPPVVDPSAQVDIAQTPPISLDPVSLMGGGFDPGQVDYAQTPGPMPPVMQQRFRGAPTPWELAAQRFLR